MKNQQRAYFYCICAALLWSSAFPAGKSALVNILPLPLAGMRLIFSGTLLLPFTLIFYRDTLKKSLHSMKWWPPISLVQTFIVFTFFNLGLNLVPASLGAIIIGLGPAIISLISHFFSGNDRLSLRRIMGLLIGILGIIAVSFKQENTSLTIDKQNILGIILLLIPNIASGLANVLILKKIPDVPIIPFGTFQNYFSGSLILAISLLTGDFSKSRWTMEGLLLTAYLAFITAAAVTLWLLALKTPNIRISSLSIWRFIIPVSGTTLSWIFLPGDSPTPTLIGGTLLITFSIIITFSEKKPL